MASVEWSNDAQRDLEKLDAPLTRRIVAKALWFEAHFETIIPERLHGPLKNLYKLRAGDYRVIYSIHGELIFIEAVRHRSEAYGR